MIRRLFMPAAAAFTLVAAPGCNSGSSTAPPYDVTIDPADFVAGIDNPYLPFVPGTVFEYEGQAGASGETNRVVVTRQTKQILGVTCIVVADSVWDEGDLEEATFDWYAQDKDGNVWYFGEDSKEIRNGVVVGTGGSWEAGVDGAKPGIVMQGTPQIGMSYRQEYLKGEAEDMAEILSLTESVTVPIGTFNQCLLTKEWTPLEPGVAEHKYYKAGVGFVSEVTVQGGSGRSVLVEVRTE